jgi:hypothetical protein
VDDFANNAAILISLNISSALLDALPSVPNATLTPANNNAGTGHTPDASYYITNNIHDTE